MLKSRSVHSPNSDEKSSLKDRLLVARAFVRDNIVENPKFKLYKRIVFVGCVVWAGVIVVQSIPYYIYIGQGKEAFQSGRFSEAEELFSQSIKESQRYDAADPRLANALNNLGEVYRVEARYVEAEPVYAKLKAIVDRNLAKKPMEAALLLNNVAAYNRDKGDYAAAEKLYEQSLSIWQTEVKKPEDSMYGSLLNGKARLYRDMGRYREAEPLYKQALAIKEKANGAHHPEVASVADNLAGLYREQARYEEAEPLFRRALAIDIKNFGHQHPDTATDENSLAGLLRSMKRYDEAEKLYMSALTTRKLLLGVNHPHTARSFIGIGEQYRETKRVEAAIPLLKEAVAIYDRVYRKADHPDTATALNALATAYRVSGQYKEAQVCLDRCLKIRKLRLTADHPDLALTLFNQAELDRATGKPKEAEVLYQAAIASQKRTLGDRHPALIASEQALQSLQSLERRH
ncbi:MAG: tetratricopeptide repeat protein [Candidatus Obscuribacterales bacterium]|nr:tetratricopeptide repeat protein [Candidatus Obscuribacterales bacterium]